MVAAALTVDVKILDAALRPIIKSVISEMEQGLLLPGPVGADDEQNMIAMGMLGELLNHAAIRIAFEDVSSVDIAFGDKPEVACLRGKRLKVKEKLGQGLFGMVFAIGATKCVKVFRIGPRFVGTLRKRFDDEVAMGKKASSLRVGPKVLDSFVCASSHDLHYGIIVMERIKGQNMRDWIESRESKNSRESKDSEESINDMRAKVEAVISNMHANGIFHNDLHLGNIMVVGKGRAARPIMIDFGTASESSAPRSVWHRDEDKNRGKNNEKRHRDYEVLAMIKSPNENVERVVNKNNTTPMVRHVVRRAINQGVIVLKL